jgi:hypothetical protein
MPVALLSLVLFVGLAGLSRFAYASPPGPVWMLGFSDDVDHDAEWLVAESAAQSAP